ncbi:universal stress protein [bacterium]|nr:universal stress protein [bacterium]
MDVFVGSTTSRVIQSSKVPVIAVKEKRMPKFDSIVLPIDLTKASKQKVKWARKFAQKYNSTVHIIMEVEEDEFLKNKVNANLKVVENYLEEHGVKYVSKLLDDRKYPDHIGKDTIQYAEEINADLIMIMTQQELKMSDLFMGSYAQQVVNSSQRTPVMAINPKKTTSFEGSEGFY